VNTARFFAGNTAVGTLEGMSKLEVLQSEAPPVVGSENVGSQKQQPLALAVASPGKPSPAAVYLARLGPGSRRAQAGALRVVAELISRGTLGPEVLPWEQLRYEHTQAIRASLAARYKAATTNRHLAALRGVLKEAFSLGLMSAEDYQRSVNISPVRGSTLLVGREVKRAELGAVFGILSETATPGAVRDAALVGVLYGGGLRRSEAVGLDLSDWQPDGTLRVLGKGNKERAVYLEGGAKAALEVWLELRGPEAGPLFYPVDKRGRIQRRRMSDQSVRLILLKRALAAGVASFAPHDLRRTYISHLFDAGADAAAIQKLAGHANLNTTGRYDRRGEEAKRRAAALLSVPFVRR
jgi:site-specific recombinase XerD